MAVTQFTVSVADDVLDDLRARIRAAHWPHDPDNADWGYGTNVAYLKTLAAYWADGFDWRKTEREINAFAHYRTVIDDVPVHFMRAPGRGPNPTPLILTHGWPWTFWDMSRVIGLLTDPGAHGGDPADAFDVIVPSLPGFGYSTPLEKPMNFWRTADIWQKLMTEELGFTRYAAAGGDWGALVTEQLGHKYASSLHGIHLIQTIPLNMFSGDRYFDLPIQARRLRHRRCRGRDRRRTDGEFLQVRQPGHAALVAFR